MRASFAEKASRISVLGVLMVTSLVVSFLALKIVTRLIIWFRIIACTAVSWKCALIKAQRPMTANFLSWLRVKSDARRVISSNNKEKIGIFWFVWIDYNTVSVIYVLSFNPIRTIANKRIRSQFDSIGSPYRSAASFTANSTRSPLFWNLRSNCCSIRAPWDTQASFETLV